MRASYTWLARLIGIGVVLQAAFIAWGGFEILHITENGGVFGGGEDTTGMALHGIVGSAVMPLLALVLLVVSFLARVPGGIRGALIVLSLTALQIVLAFLSVPAPVLGLLHGINAFVLAAAAGFASRLPAKAARPAAPEAATA